MPLANDYEQNGDLLKAAHWAEREGNVDQAINLHEQLGEQGKSSEYSERMKMSIEFHFRKAAELCREQKYFERAIKNYEKAGWSKQATELRQWKKGLEERLETDIRYSWFRAAGDVAEELGDAVRAKELYRKQIELYEEGNTTLSLSFAIDLATEINEPERLLGLQEKLFQRHEEYAKESGLEKCEYINPQWATPVAKLAEQLGHKGRAIHYYEKGHCFSDAIRLAKSTDDAGLLHRLYVKAARHGESPVNLYRLPVEELVEELGTKAVISIYDEAGRCHDAAELAVQTGDLPRAIQLYQKMNICSSPNFERAASLAEQIGEGALAREIRERGIKHFQELAQKSGDNGYLHSARRLEEKLGEEEAEKKIGS